MRNFGLILSFFALTLGACKKDKTGSCSKNSNALIIEHDDIDRAYVLHVPSGYSAGSAVSVVFVFHGFGGNAQEFMDETDMQTLSDQENFLLVSPQGTCLDGFPHWNTSLPGGDNKSSADDFGFIEKLIDELDNEYSIDRSRVYACGYSNGGMFAYGLANYKSDLVAAVGSVSGAMVDFDGTTSHPMPVIHLHGTDDGTIPFNGSADYRSAEDIVDYWVDFNNTNGNPTISNDNGIEKRLYEEGDDGVAVEFYKYNNGDHVWFSTPFEGQKAGALLWNFFSKYDLNGLRD